MLKGFANSWLPALGFLALAGTASPSLALKDDLNPPVEEDVAGEKVQRIPLDAMTPGRSSAEEESKPVTILHDPSQLPEPAQRMRRLILEAAKSGDIERLRPLLGTSTSATQLSFGDKPDDPVEFLRGLSGDDKGYEILAILLEVLESGFVEVSNGTDESLYVWPYFYAMSLDELTPEQLVELMTLATAGDYAMMQEFGAYNFFRAGITPAGEWIFFVAGD
jgi:hypothetical protein